jgi:hypothetical protein
VEWIDEARREAFERLGLARRLTPSVGRGRDLDRLLPEEIRMRALPIGNELILSYEDAVSAIVIASEHKIAVLGFDAGEVLEDGFQAFEYTGYDRGIEFICDWNSYVSMMNTRAEQWIKEHPLPKNHGYTLTSTSEEEFLQLARNRRP